MTAKPILLLDVDGVVADFLDSLCRGIARSGGRILAESSFDNWDLVGQMTPQETGAMELILKLPGFCESIGLYTTADQADVAELRKTFRVVFCTTPHSNCFWASERVAWLKKHFDAAPVDIALVKDKSLLAGYTLVDDNPDNVIAYGKGGILFRREYNKSHWHTLPSISSIGELIP